MNITLDVVAPNSVVISTPATTARKAATTIHTADSRITRCRHCRRSAPSVSIS